MASTSSPVLGTTRYVSGMLGRDNPLAVHCVVIQAVSPPSPSLAGVVGAGDRAVGLTGGQRPGSLLGARGHAPAPAPPCAR